MNLIIFIIYITDTIKCSIMLNSEYQTTMNPLKMKIVIVPVPWYEGQILVSPRG